MTAPPNGGGDTPISYSPDGTQILFFRSARGSSGRIFVVNTDGSDLRRLSPHKTKSLYLWFGPPASWSPNSKRVTIAAFDPGAIFVVAADGTYHHRIGRGHIMANWSPDGRWIAFEKHTGPGYDEFVSIPMALGSVN